MHFNVWLITFFSTQRQACKKPTFAKIHFVKKKKSTPFGITLPHNFNLQDL